MHNPEQEPFLALTLMGGMPVFNEIFVVFNFCVFVKFNNMLDVFAIQHGQLYNTLLEHKHSTSRGTCSDEYIITNHTIALLHLCVACSVDVGIGLRQEKMLLCKLHARVLKKMD